MAIAQATQARFDMGRVATRTFGVIGHNIVTFGLLSLLVAVPMSVLILDWFRLMTGFFSTPRVVDGAAGVTMGIAGLAYFVGMFVLQAGVVHGTVTYLNGKPATFRDCLATGLKHFFPLLLITLLEGLGIIGGFLLFFVPGIIFAIMWTMAVPARVAEHTGIRASLRRSRQLTRGHRWAIFGLFICFAIVQGIVNATLGNLSAAQFSFPSAGHNPDVAAAMLVAARNGLDWQNIIGRTIAAMIGAVISSTGIASIYYELRMIKEGVGPEALASVFD